MEDLKRKLKQLEEETAAMKAQQVGGTDTPTALGGRVGWDPVWQVAGNVVTK
jgi:hypothetical protein